MELDPTEFAFSGDEPITEKSSDRLDRWPFAQRIAHAILAQRGPNTLVFGVYGSWGSGKTTVLNFVEQELRDNGVKCVWFNPWFYENITYLIHSFFAALKEVYGKSGARKSGLGEWLMKYAEAIAPIEIGIPGFFNVSPGRAVKEIGKLLASETPMELRAQINEYVGDKKERIIVLIDDIDRLDILEVQAVFKLVKLMADFDYITYVLSFDDSMVAAALDKYFAGDSLVEGGAAFLEKIIQIPLHLPPADKIALVKMCFESAEYAMEIAAIKLTRDQERAYTHHFVSGFEAALETPRMVKRYGNALAFALPTLAREVNPVDLMLLEAIRVFYPPIYEVIRGNEDVFRGTAQLRAQRGDETKKHSQGIVEAGLDRIDVAYREPAKKALAALFPRLSGVFANTHYGAEWDKTWAQEQKIASQDYFKRYFLYGVPLDEISDAEFTVMTEQFESAGLEETALLLVEAIQRHGADKIIGKLRKNESEFPSGISGRLVMALSHLGRLYPNPEALISSMTPFGQAAILLERLLFNIPNHRERLASAEYVIRNADPVSFAMECFRWMRSGDEEKHEERLISKEEENSLGTLLAERIADMTKSQLLYVEYGNDAPHLYWAMARWGSKEETSRHLVETFERDPNNVVEFLKAFVTPVWMLETGLSRTGDFERQHYDALKEFVDPSEVHNALEKIYGREMTMSGDLDMSEVDLDRRIASQFERLYHQLSPGQDKQVD